MVVSEGSGKNSVPASPGRIRCGRSISPLSVVSSSPQPLWLRLAYPWGHGCSGALAVLTDVLGYGVGYSGRRLLNTA
jgi:hypothetical protein